MGRSMYMYVVCTGVHVYVSWNCIKGRSIFAFTFYCVYLLSCCGSDMYIHIHDTNKKYEELLSRQKSKCMSRANGKHELPRMGCNMFM